MPNSSPAFREFWGNPLLEFGKTLCLNIKQARKWRKQGGGLTSYW